jgi:signal transduction histidine kinase
MEQNDSLLWIGTTDGLNLYNKNSNTFKVFRKEDNPTNGLSSNYILCLYEDSKGNNWIGTRGGGFYIIENKSHGKIEFRQIQPVNDTLPFVTIHSIAESKDGIIWVGTGGAGLWKYKPSNNSVKKYTTKKDGTGLSHPYVFTILEDSFGNLWLGTPSGGVNLFDPETERFLYFQNNPENGYSINNDIILTLYENHQNELWIGTNDGLARLIPKLHKNIFQELSASLAQGKDSLFVNFGQDEGFPNSVMYGILENKNQHLWISTNKGLAEFDMSSRQVVNTFDVSDGLQSNEFNQNAYYKSHGNRFYFGGVNGFNIFHPDSVTGNSFIPPVVLTNFSIFNKTVKVGSDATGGEFHLEKAIHLMDEIDLSWKHYVIIFEFAALSYISPEKNKFSYMLEGFDKQWVEAGASRTATYTHLDPGSYVFKVRASNNSGVWNEKGTDLIINISTPPWLSWYAYLVYLLLFFTAIFIFIRFRINRATRGIKIQAQIEKAREHEREEFRKKSAADFHDEAGNKITKITLFTEMARTEIDNKLQLENYLNKIQHNITQLSSGMRDFLWVMDPQHDTLFETITRMKDVGDSMLTELGVRFTIDGMNESFRDIILPMNTRRDILLIFKEAINNCAKYARSSEVVLKASVAGHTVTISLLDNGIGFDTSKDRKKNNYGLNIMHERAKKIGAELDIKSQINKGTSISLKLNMPQMGNS